MTGSLLRSAALGAVLGAAHAGVESAILLRINPAARLISPLADLFELVWRYGATTLVLALVVAAVRPGWKAVQSAAVATGLFSFGLAVFPVHGVWLRGSPWWQPTSLLVTFGLLVAVLVLVAAIVSVSRTRAAIPLLAIVLVIPVVLVLLSGADRDLAPAAAAEARLPDVTVILIDTLRADGLGCYGARRADGKAISPVIDEQARNGARFESCYASSPWTRPSVASLFTGLASSSHGTYTPYRALPQWCRTLGEIFHGRGYRTAAFSGNTNVSAVFGYDQGFQHFWCLHDKTLRRMSTWGMAEERIARRLGRNPYPDDARRINRKVFDWLDRLPPPETRRPVFTYVHYMDPHKPYDAPEDLLNASPSRFANFVPRAARSDRDFDAWPFDGLVDLDPEVIASGWSRYEAEIRFVDREFGLLLQRLESAGLLGEDDYLILTSDHGEEFFEHGQTGHGQNLFSEVTQVPLIVRGPGIPPDRVVPDPVSLLDLFPTLLGWIGIEVESPGPGRSLQPLLSGIGEDEPRLVYAEKLQDEVHHALRVGDHRLVEVPEPGTDRPFTMLFDLGSDPDEQHPWIDTDRPPRGLVIDPTAIRNAGPEEKGRILEYSARMHDIGARAFSMAGDAAEVELDEETRKRLEALGYI